LRLITSAERRFAAISNVVRVRVEGFEEQVCNTALPRNKRHFLDLALGDRKKGVRGVEDAHDDVARKTLGRSR